MRRLFGFSSSVGPIAHRSTYRLWCAVTKRNVKHLAFAAESVLKPQDGTKVVVEAKAGPVISMPVKPGELGRPIEDLPRVMEYRRFEIRMKTVAILERQQHQILAVETIQCKAAERRRPSKVRTHIKRDGIAAALFVIDVEPKTTNEGALSGTNRHPPFQHSVVVEVTEAAFIESMLIGRAEVRSSSPSVLSLREVQIHVGASAVESQEIP